MSKNQLLRTFRPQKNSISRPRFSSSADGLPAVALAEAGTKLSFQFAVPNVRRTHSQFTGVPRFGGIRKLTHCCVVSSRRFQKFSQLFAIHNSRLMRYLQISRNFDNRWTRSSAISSFSSETRARALGKRGIPYLHVGTSRCARHNLDIFTSDLIGHGEESSPRGHDRAQSTR